jgi:hypothetical protein
MYIDGYSRIKCWVQGREIADLVKNNNLAGNKYHNE